MTKNNQIKPRTFSQLQKRIKAMKIEQKLLKKSMQDNYTLGQIQVRKGLFKLITIAGVGLISATLLKSLHKKIKNKPIAEMLLNFALKAIFDKGHSKPEMASSE